MRRDDEVSGEQRGKRRWSEVRAPVPVAAAVVTGPRVARRVGLSVTWFLFQLKVQ
jgi:hypothetical protein